MQAWVSSTRRRTLPVLLAVVATCLLGLPLGSAELPSYKSIDLIALASHLSDVLTVPEAATPEYWEKKPSLAATYAFPLHPVASEADLQAVSRLKKGEFRPYDAFPWTNLGVPPSWDVNPGNNTTWDFYRHSLEWLQPLVDVGVEKGDQDSLLLVERVMEDWIRRNSTPPGQSSWAWNDSGTAKRVRVFCWFWEAARTKAKLPPDFERLLLASVYQHASYLADPQNYPQRSNHGLEMNGALLAAAVTFPEFRDAAEWRKVAEQRLEQYVADNFDSQGFHLEQSPSYHYYVLGRLVEIIKFLTANKQPVPQAVTVVATKASSVMRYLVEPDKRYPKVGDSEGEPPTDWQSGLAAVLGGTATAPPASTLANPRKDGASFLLSFDSGYSIFTSYPVAAENRQSDTYALFKCNSFQYAHSHCDASSFVLYGLGRDWIVDSGKLNYEDTPERKYMVSSRAHNVVLVDNADFQYNPMKLVDYGRDAIGDYVTVRQELPQANHTRTFEFLPPDTVWITDVLESADEKPHTYSQLFHVAPGLQVKQVAPSRQVIAATDGSSCVVDQLSPVGQWKVITGQKEPFLQGWYSPSFNKIEPSSVLYFTSLRPCKQTVFVTRLSLLGKPGTTPAASAQPPGQTLPRPAAGSPLVVFADPLDQYVSRWSRNARTVLKRQDQGVRCDIVGSRGVAGSQYGGIRFPVQSAKAVKLELSFLKRTGIATLWVDAYDAAGTRVARWTRSASASHPLPKRASLVFPPGKQANGFTRQGPADLATAAELDVFMLIDPGSRNGFILHKAEVVSGAPVRR